MVKTFWLKPYITMDETIYQIQHAKKNRSRKK